MLTILILRREEGIGPLWRLQQTRRCWASIPTMNRADQVPFLPYALSLRSSKGIRSRSRPRGLSSPWILPHPSDIRRAKWFNR
jgi:hypothetical protein